MLIEGVKLLPLVVRAAEKYTLGVRGAPSSVAAGGASGPNHIKAAAAVDSDSRPGRRDAGQIDGEREIRNRVVPVHGLARQDVFGRQFIRPEQVDVRPAIGEELEVVIRTTEKAFREPPCRIGTNCQPVRI